MATATHQVVPHARHRIGAVSVTVHKDPSWKTFLFSSPF